MDADWNVVFSTTSEEKGTRLETPVSSMPVGEPTGKKPLVGVWEVKVSPIGQSQSPLLSLAMYAGDGSFNATVGYKALPSTPAVQDVATEIGLGYGQWAATSEREFRLMYYCVLWKAGLVNGFQRVQDTLVLAESGDEYTGRAQVDFLDANWNVVFSTTSDVKGTNSKHLFRLRSPHNPPKERGSGKTRYRGVLGCRSRLGWALFLAARTAPGARTRERLPRLPQLQKELPASSTHPVTADW